MSTLASTPTLSNNRYEPIGAARELFHRRDDAIVLSGPAGCVAPETRIYDPTTDKHNRIVDLYQRGISPIVKTLFGESCATVPFIKGTAPLYRIRLFSGRAVIVTVDHLLLGRDGWLPVAGCLPGTWILVSSPAPLATQGEGSQWEQIESIVFERVDKYYDLHVPGVGHYLAEGIWHHNTGKSRAGLQKLHAALWKYGGARGIMIRKTRHSLTQTAMVTYENEVISPLQGITFHTSAQEYRYPNNSKLIVAGMDKASKVMSSQYDMAYVQEAIELSENDWEFITTRLRNGVMPYQQLIGDVNPSAPTHWLKRKADAGLVLMLDSLHQDNPVYWDREKEDWTERGKAYIGKLDQLTGVRLQRLRYGRWVSAEGVVYEGWNGALHLLTSEQIPLCTRYICGVDWGFTNPGTILCFGVDGDGRMYLVHEVYQTEKTIDWWLGEARKIEERYHPEAFVCDPSQPGFIEQYNRAGYRAVVAKNDIGLGIQVMQKRLQVAGDGRPRFFISRDALILRDRSLAEAGKPACTSEEFDSYVWPQQVEGHSKREVPVDDFNHGLDAARYVAMYLALPDLPHEYHLDTTIADDYVEVTI